METLTNYEEDQVNEILQWKQQEPSVVAKGLGVLMKPLAMVLQILIPNSVIRGALNSANDAGAFLADEEDICRDGHVQSVEELKHKDLAVSDRLADEVHNWAIAIAMAEGGGAGALGAPGMAIDIPALLLLSTRTIHKIGLCYGYKAVSEEEKIFALNILSVAGSNSMKEKQAALAELLILKNTLKIPWKKMGEKGMHGMFLKLIRELCKQLGINFTKRKAAQAIPIVGAGIGALANGDFIRDVGYAARRSYQERWLTENHKWKRDD
ncbi:EcsC family protein [uncultured Selenomonas sp.]|uniref:EcsC family protein n=1 Tax=uncultured Selenomonas sp. TaxID=159275 RepID=UPI0028DBF9A1|nr:EcsC family protein [uncultured Selenomonas sp.]